MTLEQKMKRSEINLSAAEYLDREKLPLRLIRRDPEGEYPMLAVQLRFAATPDISSQPEDAAVLLGETAELRVEASPPRLHFPFFLL